MIGPRRYRASTIRLDKIVSRILLDTDLLRYFASSGGRRTAVMIAIDEAKKQRPHPVLDFLERHCGGPPSGT